MQQVHGGKAAVPAQQVGPVQDAQRIERRDACAQQVAEQMHAVRAQSGGRLPRAHAVAQQHIVIVPRAGETGAPVAVRGGPVPPGRADARHGAVARCIGLRRAKLGLHPAQIFRHAAEFLRQQCAALLQLHAVAAAVEHALQLLIERRKEAVKMAAALAELRREVRSLRLAALQQPPGCLLERIIGLAGIVLPAAVEARTAAADALRRPVIDAVRLALASLLHRELSLQQLEHLRRIPHAARGQLLRRGGAGGPERTGPPQPQSERYADADGGKCGGRPHTAQPQNAAAQCTAEEHAGEITAHDPRCHGRQQQSRRHAPAEIPRQAERRSGSAHGRQLRRAVDHGAAPDEPRIDGQTERRQAAQPAQQRRKIQRPPPLSRSGPAAQDGRSHTSRRADRKPLQGGPPPAVPAEDLQAAEHKGRSGRHGRQKPPRRRERRALKHHDRRQQQGRQRDALGRHGRLAQQGIACRRAERRRQRSPPERQRGRQAGPERQGQPADLRPGRQEAAPEQQQALPEPVQPDGRTRQPLFRQKLLRTGLFHELLPSPVRGEGRAAALPNDLSRF